MNEIVILSGKGGTGKTSLTASFAALAHPAAVLVDADVDAADLHLVLKPEVKQRHAFISGKEASIREADCTRCGLCETLCRFEAIHDGAIDEVGCEGCGVCVAFCPEQAIDFRDRNCGDWMLSESRYGPMVHARLEPAAENSGKLVSHIRQEARTLAETCGAEWILIDGPPGIGCPVIASLTGASAAVAVTEPTHSGLHDLERLLSLTHHFKMPTYVCVNKWDINPEMAARIEEQSRDRGAIVLERIPYDPAVTQAQIEGGIVLDQSANGAAEAIRANWSLLCDGMKNSMDNESRK